MTLSKENKRLKEALLNEVSGNIETLQGKMATFIDGKPVTATQLIDESINDLTQLAELMKGED